jgi:energy-coupling factor transport system substrate-specific component
MLAAYAAAACLAYGLLMDLWFWPYGTGTTTSLSYEPGAGLATNLGRFLAFHAATAFGFDIPRAALNAVLVLTLGRPVLGALRRANRRAAFDVPVHIHPG